MEEPGTNRIEAFTDGVVAIILTIMVLELHLPEAAAEGTLWSGLLGPLAPKLVSYVLSFLVIAGMWMNHHQLLHTIRHASRRLIWLNNNLLFWMSLIPLATGFVGEHPFLPRAMAVYAFVLTMSSTGFTLLRLHAMRMAASGAPIDRANRRIMAMSIVASALYALAVPAAFVSVYLSMAFIVVVPAVFFVSVTAPLNDHSAASGIAG